jgi:hypothetical protein
MCTVSFVPIGKNHIVLTSNRDELVGRSTMLPKMETVNGNKVIYPKDMLAGGTWITAGSNGKVYCLLNGAYEKHEPKASYKKSRGKVVIEALAYSNFNEFIQRTELEGIEPFTLIALEMDSETTLTELRWDGSLKHIDHLNAKTSHFWSSATLYDSKIRDLREGCFYKWVKKFPRNNGELIMNFHSSNHGIGPENDLVMKREKGPQTVSITQVEMAKESFKMDYYRVLEDQAVIFQNEIKGIRNA